MSLQSAEFPGFGQLRQWLSGCGLGGHERPADFFQSEAWFELLWSCGLDPASPRGDLRLCAVHDPSTGCAWCWPLVARGGRMEPLSNYYTGLYGPMRWRRQAGGAGPEALARATLALATRWRRLSAFAELVLGPVDPQQPEVASLLGQLAVAGLRGAVQPAFGNWHLPLDGQPAATVLAALPSQLRGNMERGRKRLDAAGPWSVEVHTRAGNGLGPAIEAFQQVYARSWKVAEPNPRFIPALAAWAASTGALRLGLVKLDGEAIAAQLWLVDQGVAHIFKLAHTEVGAQFSAGSILTWELLRHACESDRVRGIDFLSGDDAYKKDWMAARRQRCTISVCRRSSAKGWARAVALHLGQPATA